MTLIHNERTKLAANALDRLSTAFVVVGVLGKTFSFTPGADMWFSLVSTAGWMFGAAVLHYMARKLLGRLVP
jgi:VIT1/CCC1 family predicted Fe2+/Mn2+ transporter